MILVELLQKNSNLKMSEVAWGQAVLDMVNLQLPDDRAVTNSITSRAMLEVIFGMEPKPRSVLLQIDITLSDDDPLNTTPANARKKLLLTAAVCMFVALVVIIAGYMAVTAKAGGEVDQGTLSTLLGMLGKAFNVILSGGG